MRSLKVHFESIVVEIKYWSLNQMFHSLSFQLILQVIYIYVYFLLVVQIPDYKQCIFSDRHLNFVALVKSFNFLVWQWVATKRGSLKHYSKQRKLKIINNYSTSARWIWFGYNHLISNKSEWNNCFIKNAPKISRILSDFICKNNRFSACV